MNSRYGTNIRLLVPSASLAVLLASLATVPALAHAGYLRSEPGMGAVVGTAPTRVQIWFAQELFRRAGENWIHVEGPGGERVDVGEAQVDDDDRTYLWVELQSGLEPGEYHVSWRNLSADDGDSDEGEFGFAFDPQAEVTSTPMQAKSPTLFPSATAEATATAQSAPEATSGPATASSEDGETSGGCALGLLPAGGLALLAVPGLRKRRSAR